MLKHALLAMAVSACVSTAFAEEASLKERLVGTWKLVSWESLRANHEAVNLFMGPHPTGLLMYQANGHMAATFMGDTRPKLPVSDATCDEVTGAFWSYYGYWGTYTINDAGDGVVHTVEGSERPFEVGRKYSRSITIQGTRLIVTTPSFKAGTQLPHQLLADHKVSADEVLTNRLTFERVQ